MQSNRGVLDGELAGEPGRIRVVDVELRLQATDPVAPGGDGGERPAQLVGLGRILRVVDDDVVAVRPLQRVLDGARLGSRLAIGHDEHAHVGVEIGPAERQLRLCIGPLDDEHDFEAVRRVVERAQRSQQLGDDASLAEQRNENRVLRQRRVGHRGGKCGGANWMAQLPQGHRTQHHDAKEGKGHDG